MEELKSTKIAFAKNLNKHNFNLTLTMPIDTNANIKNILDISSYIFDQKVECGNGKAIFSGKIGTKVLYVDTDNFTNTMSTSQTFNETYIDDVLTNDTFVNILNSTIVNNILSSENVLKINCDVSISPIAYLNLSLNNNIVDYEDLIVKKSEIYTQTVSKQINTSFDYTTSFETSDHVSKILCHNAYFCANKITSNENIAIVEGKICSYILYECSNQDEQTIKRLDNVTNLKYEIELDSLTNENILDLSFSINKSQEVINTEREDNLNIITIKNNIQVCGIALKPVNLNLVNDLYSTKNELELVKVNREYSKTTEHYSIIENVNNEINLNSDEEAIDEIVANLNILPEHTNTYIKDSNLYLEGIISSNLIFVNENKEIKQKQLEIPFIINSKIDLNELPCVHVETNITDYKCKVKRGVVIELEYLLHVNVDIYKKETQEIVDNFKLGKALDYGNIDFQIYLAKPNESMWDLCKRIKVSPDEISKLNKNLPLVMQGGEKIIIKR